MDLQTAVAASMLSGSRTLIASFVKDIRHRDVSGAVALSAVLSQLGFPRDEHDEICELALQQAKEALTRGRAAGFHAAIAGDSGYPPLLACIPDPPPGKPTNCAASSAIATSADVRRASMPMTRCGKRGMRISAPKRVL